MNSIQEANSLLRSLQQISQHKDRPGIYLGKLTGIIEFKHTFSGSTEETLCLRFHITPTHIIENGVITASNIRPIWTRTFTPSLYKGKGSNTLPYFANFINNLFRFLSVNNKSLTPAQKLQWYLDTIVKSIPTITYNDGSSDVTIGPDTINWARLLGIPLRMSLETGYNGYLDLKGAEFLTDTKSTDALDKTHITLNKTNLLGYIKDIVAQYWTLEA